MSPASEWLFETFSLVYPIESSELAAAFGKDRKFIIKIMEKILFNVNDIAFFPIILKENTPIGRKHNSSVKWGMVVCSNVFFGKRT